MALQLNHFNGVTAMSTLQTRSSSGTATRTSMTTNVCSSKLPSLVRTSQVNTRSLDKRSSRTPSRYTSVQCAATASTSTKELSVGIGKYDEKELPPLLESLKVEGFPPCQRSVYSEESLAYILTMGPADMFEPYYITLNSFISFVHCGAVSAGRLAALAGMCTLMTVIDDILFDKRADDAVLEKLGIDPAILASPTKILDYMRAMDALMRQEEEPEGPITAIDDMLWKIGRDLRALSPNRDWFNRFADTIADFFTANFDHYYSSNLDSKSKPQTLETFTEIRSRTAAGGLASCAVQFSQNAYLPPEIEDHPVLQRMTKLATTYTSYVQDIFSFSIEALDEGSTSNLLYVLMTGDEEVGKTLPRAAWQAVNITRALAQEFMELEATQLPSTWREGERGTSDVRLYVDGLKELIAGDLYWHGKTKRYRHPDALFPELRDVNISFLPEADFVIKGEA